MVSRALAGGIVDAAHLSPNGPIHAAHRRSARGVSFNPGRAVLPDCGLFHRSRKRAQQQHRFSPRHVQLLDRGHIAGNRQPPAKRTNSAITGARLNAEISRGV